MNTLDRIVLSLMFLTFLAAFREVQAFVVGFVLVCAWVVFGWAIDREEKE